MSEEVVDMSILNDDDKDAFASQKLKMFKYTIATCAIYGVISIIILCLAIFTKWGKELFYNNIFPFTITYIIGTIIIIAILSNNIYNFKPTKKTQSIGYDAEICPDYWQLNPVDIDGLKDENGQSYFKSNVNTNHFKYKCTPNTDLFNTNNTIQYDSNFQNGSNGELIKLLDSNIDVFQNDTNKSNKFKEYSATMNGYHINDSNELTPTNNNKLSGNFEADINNVPLDCSSVYPMYLSVMDAENSKNNPSEPSNVYRCAYSKTCKVPWSDAGCKS